MIKYCLFIASLLLVIVAAAQPNVAKQNFHLFLLAGQSNMAGRGEVDTNINITNAKIWMLNKNNEWQLAKHPLHFDKPGIAGVGPGLAFAKALLDYDTSIVIGLIPTAVGGTSIDFWKPNSYFATTKVYPYDDAIKRTYVAIQTGNLKGILWHQGESDADSIKSIGYLKKMTALVKQFRKDLNYNAMPFITGTIPPFYLDAHPYGKSINKAIKKLPRKLNQTAIVFTGGLTAKEDKIHLNSASANELGNRYASVFIKKFAAKKKNK
jgi:Carbohydrate esterase, sialic acid-specific acetylesterase